MLCAYPYVLLFQTVFFDYKENHSAKENMILIKINGMFVVINHHSSLVVTHWSELLEFGLGWFKFILEANH